MNLCNPTLINPLQRSDPREQEHQDHQRTQQVRQDIRRQRLHQIPQKIFVKRSGPQWRGYNRRHMP